MMFGFIDYCEARTITMKGTISFKGTIYSCKMSDGYAFTQKCKKGKAYGKTIYIHESYRGLSLLKYPNNRLEIGEFNGTKMNGYGMQIQGSGQIVFGYFKDSDFRKGILFSQWVSMGVWKGSEFVNSVEKSKSAAKAIKLVESILERYEQGLKKEHSSLYEYMLRSLALVKLFVYVENGYAYEYKIGTKTDTLRSALQSKFKDMEKARDIFEDLYEKESKISTEQTNLATERTNLLNKRTDLLNERTTEYNELFERFNQQSENNESSNEYFWWYIFGAVFIGCILGLIMAASDEDKEEIARLTKKKLHLDRRIDVLETKVKAETLLGKKHEKLRITAEQKHKKTIIKLQEETNQKTVLKNTVASLQQKIQSEEITDEKYQNVYRDIEAKKQQAERLLQEEFQAKADLNLEIFGLKKLLKQEQQVNEEYKKLSGQLEVKQDEIEELMKSELASQKRVTDLTIELTAQKNTQEMLVGMERREKEKYQKLALINGEE